MSNSAPDMLELPMTGDAAQHAIAPRIAAIAAATDTSSLRERAYAALRAIMPEQQASLVWAAAGTHEAATAPPQDAAPAARTAERHPLRAGDALLGWLLLEPGPRTAEQEQWLQLLIAMVASAARGLQPRPLAALARRQAALREQLVALRRASSPELLLRDLSALIKASVPFQHICWMLRYRDSPWLGLVYASLGASPEWPRIFWTESAGLSGLTLLAGEPIYADDYRAECARRGITPILDERLGAARSWYGVPLRDNGASFGVMVLYSTEAGVALSDDDRALLAWLADEVAPLVLATERYERASREAAQRAALNLITRQINRSLDPAAVPALIVERAPGLLNAEEASLLLLDEETRDLVFRYAAGPAGNSLLGRRVPAGAGVAGFVASSGEPTIVNDTSADGRFYRDLDGDSGFQTRSIVAVPLRGIDGVRGVIEVLNRRDNAPFTEQDRELLEALADQAVIALENAQKFASKERALARRAQELDRSNHQLVKILQASNALRAERPLNEILDQIAGVVVESSGFRGAAVALVRSDRAPEPALELIAAAGSALPSPAVAPIPLARITAQLRPEFRCGSLTYLVEDGGLPELLPRCGPGEPRSGSWHDDDLLLVLLYDSHGATLGLIAVAAPEDGNRPTAEQVRILEILANQASAAIENATLYAAQQHSLSRMMALNGLGRALSTTLRSTQQIFELTASGMREMSGSAWATVFAGDPETPSFRVGFHTGGSASSEVAVERLAREAVIARRPLSRRPTRQSEGMLAIPLLGSSRCLGAICVGYAELLPDAGDVESLILFASQAASAVESLLLLGEVRLGRDQLATIMASTREGMLLVDAEGRVVVANDAFFHLADAVNWLGHPDDAAALAGLPLRDLLWRWQTAVSFPPAELEQLHSGLAAVADGPRPDVGGQLTGMAPGALALEWSVLRAANTGSAPEHAAAPTHSWPILLTVRDITAAKEAERLRNDLTNMMVHDLRSPLSSIISSLELIFRGVIGASTLQQRDVLTIAHNSAQKLLNMINMLLDISRLEGGRMPLELAEQPCHELAGAALETLQLLAGTKGVTLQVEAEPAVRVLADRELVLRVLQNLLDNALKFSPRGGAIVLSALPVPEHPGQVRFAVRDSGIGIKPQDREQIFAKFGQVGNRRNSGSGLGLTFCKLVVETHGGRIWVESEPGSGSCFYFTLPCPPTD